TKKKIGGMSNPSLESIIMLKPDLVVMTTDGNPKEVEEKLRALKIKIYVFRARQISELADNIRDLGAAIDMKKKADLLANNVEKSLNKFKPSAVYKKKKILFIVWPEPLIVAGPGTAMDDAINIFGNTNIASEAKISYPKFSIEEIMRRAPDVIIIGKGHSDMKKISSTLIKKLSNVPAVKNNKVFFVSDSLYRFGPRIIKGIEEMSECLR
ncbi:MAG: helical backbone metal receptor, partial [Nitrospiraceae bacterium]|nr:helical backbone metal receptor [Nitrospiraceae bacterium]